MGLSMTTPTEAAASASVDPSVVEDRAFRAVQFH